MNAVPRDHHYFVASQIFVEETHPNLPFVSDWGHFCAIRRFPSETYGIHHAFTERTDRTNPAQRCAVSPGGARRIRVEPERFDELAASVAEGKTSRRSVVLRVGGGAFAALLARLGVGGLDVEEAGAKKSCRKRCKRRKTAAKRRRCRRRCKKSDSNRCTPSCTGSAVCVGGDCIAQPTTCTGTGQGTCGTGFLCVGGICLLGCTTSEQCDDALVCLGGTCVLDDECDEDQDCDTLEVCFLGLCLDLDL